LKGGDIIRCCIHIQTDEQSNQFLWKKVPIKPKKTEKPYPLSHEVGNRGGERVSELVRKAKSMETAKGIQKK
jgi:hypothetical protein